MREFHGEATTVIDVSPQAIFDLIVDIDRLPEWNRSIEAVVERPRVQPGQPAGKRPPSVTSQTSPSLRVPNGGIAHGADDQTGRMSARISSPRGADQRRVWVTQPDDPADVGSAGSPAAWRAAVSPGGELGGGLLYRAAPAM
jgi:hypothetical protein